ncbi:DUF3422 domain-containing protein [Pelagibacterium luteolum]|uniref:Uncharacterized membrane-anchored protein n=1 Tax=Pelagibacterium luteolum TaxID=440168 RepID=A0A1G7XNT3_9HYPH|nr:DUF3422 domain-containing protein [Pelagibacterium luteolum]SDG85909.1 Uncharacterized membrane-anchored protein [Pelagibacterium luteolum]
MCAFPLTEHPYRDAVLAELHARPVELVETNMRVRRLVLAVPTRSGAMRAAIARFEDFAAANGYAVSNEGGRQFQFQTAERLVSWEFHTEFITLTWYSPLTDAENLPGDIGLDALDEAELLGAMRVDMIDEPELPERVFPSFNPTSLCFVAVEFGNAQIAADFVPDDDKFIRFEFAAAKLSPLRRAITLRRILEVETYRTMALLALPLARQTAPALRAVEMELTDVVEDLSGLDTIDAVQERLKKLHDLSVRSGQISEQLNYRFAASYAYGAILKRRLEKLRETTMGQGSSLSSFIGNRVEPALATFEAMDKRLSVLSQKLERAIELLNVRISLDMQIQNKAVLDTIAETAKSQFRLQHAVEGLSTIAITYYLIGILGYALAAPLEATGWNKTLVISILSPLALLMVFFGLRALRRGMSKGK